MLFKLVKNCERNYETLYVEVRLESSNLKALFELRITFIVVLFQANTDA